MTLAPTGLRRMAGWASAAPTADAARRAADAAAPAAGGAPANPASSRSLPDDGPRRGTRNAQHCELCPTGLSADHRHLLQLDERRIVCVCETCWALHSGDPAYRPTGSRVLWLDGFALDDELWAAFQIPIGLAFMLRSGAGDGPVVALYPSPAGATERELDLDAWERLRAANPVLERLEPDAEALIVNRLADPPQHAIAPIDDCYRLVGAVKESWRGISGGSEVERAVAQFFARLREEAREP